MPSGGARARSGPAPDPMSLRAGGRDADSWTTLPAAGREGDPPEFPLARPTKRERKVWEDEWKRPQAIEWERNHQQYEVALYVRSLVAAEKSSAPVNARTLVRQQQEALGISLPGLHRNRWRIADVPKAEDESEKPQASASTAPSGRDRFAVIPGGNRDA